MGRLGVALLSILIGVELIAIVVIAGVLFVVGTGTTTAIAAGMLLIALVSVVATVFVLRRGRARTH